MQAENIAKLRANETIGRAVADYFSENRFMYCDLAAVLYGEDGRAVSVEAISANINRVQSELTVLINRRFADTGRCCAEIPIGSLTGSYLLAGKGPRLRVMICPAENANVKLCSSFTSAGENQTCHRIYADITADISSSLPLYSFSSTVSFEFLIAESVIVGEVPDIARYAWEDNVNSEK